MYITFTKKQLAFWCVSICVAIISCMLLGFTGAHATFYAKTQKKLPIYYVDTQEKKVALTFDCAWGVDYTDSLLTTMAENGVKSTFFTVEFWSEKYPEHLKKISDAGHEIGTHSATHPHMSKLSKSAIQNELVSSCKVIEQITGKQPRVFRAPFGEYNDLVITTANDLGLHVIQWDVDSLDWKDLSANEITSRVLKRVKNGSIILFHNQGKHTAEALPQIIRQLKQDGYQFSTVGEMIYKTNYYVAPDGCQKSNL